MVRQFESLTAGNAHYKYGHYKYDHYKFLIIKISFTPSSSPLVTEMLEVIVMRTGYVTDYMHMMKPGAYMGIRGSYGRGYPVEKFFGKEVLILGGGCDFAPIRSLLYTDDLQLRSLRLHLVMHK